MGRIQEAIKNRKEENLYQFEGIAPISKSFTISLQHVMALFFSNITPFMVVAAAIGTKRFVDPAIINNAIRTASLISGLATLLQVLPIWKFGTRMPILIGSSFTFSGVCILIGSMFGLQTMFLSLIFGGIIATVIGLFAKFWVKFIPAIVSGIVVFGVGLSLLPAGIQQLFALTADVPGLFVDGIYQFEVAWPYLLVGFITLISSVLFQFLFKGKFKNSSILIGLAIGYVVSLCFIPYNNMVDFSSFSVNAVTDVIDVPRPIFTLLSFSSGDINIGSIIAVTVIFLVSMVETMGGTENYAQSVETRPASKDEHAGAIASNSLMSVVSSCFGGMPLTVYNQNVAIVAQTKVKNRFVIILAASVLILISFFPIVASFLTTIPVSVLGGCLLPLFASIAISGLRIIARSGWSAKNVLILTLSLGIGYGLFLVPEITYISSEGSWSDYLKLVLQNPVAMMFIIGLVSYYIIPKSLETKEG